MKKGFLCLLAAIVFAAAPAAMAAESVPDFSEDFESYAPSGNFIEQDADLTEKWENNVFSGGEPLGMDAHIVGVGRIEAEPGNSENQVLHLVNTSGADSFFYMGPRGMRARNFRAGFRVKFLTEGVRERSWVGFSLRKKANVHYTGTNNLLFFVQRYADSDQVTGHAHAVFGGGDPADLSQSGGLYGEKLKIERKSYTLPGARAGADTDWLDVKVEVTGNRYLLYADDQVILDCTFDVPTFDYYGALSLNCCTSNILVDDFYTTVTDETPPPEILPLSAPVVTWNEDEKILTWERVEGASAYRVTVNGTGHVVYGNEYSLAALKPGSYSVTVTAISDDTFEALDSPASVPIAYTVSGNGEEEPEGGCRGNGAAALSLAALCAVSLLKRFG